LGAINPSYGQPTTQETYLQIKQTTRIHELMENSVGNLRNFFLNILPNPN